MLARTHLAFGFLAALAALPFANAGNKFIFFGLVLLGALLPDIDQPNSRISSKIPVIPNIINFFSKHRGIFHTLFLAVLIPGIIWYFAGRNYGIAIFAGYLSHLIIDGFTKSGINFLHPLSNLRLSGFIKTGGFGEHIILAIILVLIIFKIV